MILVVCAGCGLGLRIEGEDDVIDSLVGQSSAFWPDKYPCADCGKMGQVFRDREIGPGAAQQLRVVSVTPEEAFAAFEGLGLPLERSARLEDLRALLQGSPVVRIAGKDVLGTSRCIVDYLELADGTRMYFGSSANGATVYRVTKKISYAERVEAEHG